MAPDRDRVLLACIADCHAGFKLGLAEPEAELVDYDEKGNEYPFLLRATEWTKYLWNELHLPNLNKLKKLAGKDPVIFIAGGDPTHGDKYGQELYSTAMHVQIQLAIRNYVPVFERLPTLKEFILVASTDSHVFFEGSADNLIREWLRSKYDNVRLVPHGLITLPNEQTIDAAHHGPGPGIRIWTRGNVARLYLKDRMLHEIMNGNKVPLLYLRAHYHADIDVVDRILVADEEYWSRLVILPSMSGPSIYSRQATKNLPEIANGMIVFEIVDGAVLKKHRWVKTQDLRTVINYG